MRLSIVLLIVGLLIRGTPAQADIFPGEAPEDETGATLSPIRAGRLEIIPILSAGINEGGEVFYRGGVSVGYALSRLHQVGGSFVVGNRAYDRFGDQTEIAGTPVLATQTRAGNPVSAEDGFGSSLSGFYRLNIPLRVDRRTSPFLEAFAARDYWGWSGVSEVGGGIGFRRSMSNRTALTTRYAYVALFNDGKRLNRHVATVGISMFFR
ncbi:MAG: hypothetical protein OXU79_06860 [Gemmatimonadota bacterium]|nr:hypothetical protein [Gemmatimonadota bacterium]